MKTKQTTTSAPALMPAAAAAPRVNRFASDAARNDALRLLTLP